MGSKIKILIGVFILCMVLIGGMQIFKENKDIFSSQFFCQNSEECRVKINCGYCGDICVPKDHELKCDPEGPKCEYTPYSSDLVCGCINHTCQFSHELFTKYEKIKTQAKKMVFSNPEEAVHLCDKLHGEYIFECYADLAEELIFTNVSQAIKICEEINKKSMKDIALKDPGSLWIRVENDCYYRIATKIVNNNPELAIELCKRASAKIPCVDCINYRAFCVREIIKTIAKINLIQALKACEIENISGDENYCKFLSIKIFKEKYKDDLQEIIKRFTEPNICETANFSGYMSEYYKTQCFIFLASILAENKNTEEAVNFCNSISENYYRNECYYKIAKIISEYDFNKAVLICDKIKGNKQSVCNSRKCKDDVKK